MPTGPHDRNDDFMTHEPPELQRLQGQTNDREITLSSGTILGIFFALALLCAIVFGMGYTLGRRSSQALASADASSSDSSSFGSKPSPQSIAMQPAAPFPAPSTTDSAVTVPTTTTSTAPPPAAAEDTKPTPPPAHAATAAAPPVQAPAPIVSAPQSSVVQIAAVSHQEDAAVLLSALRKKGYAVSAHSEPQDKLIHIQVGPFNNRKDADAMRQRLLNDGYNAIVK
jgi:cell division septation protein DedD